MSFVVDMPNAAADSEITAFASAEPSSLATPDPLPSVSARETICFADAIKASRSSNAFPMTISLFLRTSSPRLSRPAIPASVRVGAVALVSVAGAVTVNPGDDVGFDGVGTGGAS